MVQKPPNSVAISWPVVTVVCRLSAIKEQCSSSSTSSYLPKDAPVIKFIVYSIIWDVAKLKKKIDFLDPWHQPNENGLFKKSLHYSHFVAERDVYIQDNPSRMLH